jgi:hypothetical protein
LQLSGSFTRTQPAQFGVTIVIFDDTTRPICAGNAYAFNRPILTLDAANADF